MKSRIIVVSRNYVHLNKFRMLLHAWQAYQCGDERGRLILTDSGNLPNGIRIFFSYSVMFKSQITFNKKNTVYKQFVLLLKALY